MGHPLQHGRHTLHGKNHAAEQQTGHEQHHGRHEQCLDLGLGHVADEQTEHEGKQDVEGRHGEYPKQRTRQGHGQHIVGHEQDGRQHHQREHHVGHGLGHNHRQRAHRTHEEQLHRAPLLLPDDAHACHQRAHNHQQHAHDARHEVVGRLHLGVVEHLHAHRQPRPGPGCAPAGESLHEDAAGIVGVLPRHVGVGPVGDELHAPLALGQTGGKRGREHHGHVGPLAAYEPLG